MAARTPVRVRRRFASRFCRSSWPIATDFFFFAAGAAALLSGCSRSGQCEALDAKDKAALDECNKWFAKCGFKVPKPFPVRKCKLPPNTYGQAEKTPGKDDCEIHVPLDWASRGLERCQTLIHEILHCHCDIFEREIGSGRWEDVHQNVEGWAIYLWQQCAFDYGAVGKPSPPPGRTRPPRATPISGWPAGMCSNIKRGILPPRIVL